MLQLVYSEGIYKMKLNLCRNKKFLLILLVLAITYCHNVNATVCKWDGCVPMFKDWYHISYHRFNRTHKIGDINHLNGYTDHNIEDIKNKCDYWEGQWPLNCPMKLTEKREGDNIMWTDELLEEFNLKHQSNPWKCKVTSLKLGLGYQYGPFGEVINFPQSGPKTDMECNETFKLYPFLPELKMPVKQSNSKQFELVTTSSKSPGLIQIKVFNTDKQLIEQKQEILKEAALKVQKYMNDAQLKNHGHDSGIFHVDKYFSPQLFKKVIDAVENQGDNFVFNVKEALVKNNLLWLYWQTLGNGSIYGNIAKWVVSQLGDLNPIARCITSSCN
jgi:hypothetical protein